MLFNNDWAQQTYQERGILFFWGHQPTPTVSKSCFSQWWVAPFIVNGKTYPTAEHWMMAGKAILFKDDVMEEQILQATTPKAAKLLGRNVSGFDGALWDACKFDLVREGNFHKFSQHPELKDFLLQTGDQIIVEASPVDKIWGIGMAAENPNAGTPALWQGENLLGYALMEVRELLRNNNVQTYAQLYQRCPAGTSHR